jgi:hypothetical protein
MSVEEVVTMFIDQKVLVYDGKGKYILDPKYNPKNTSKNNKKTDDFEILLNTYSELWPKGVKSGGRLIRKTPASLKTKMQAFVNKRKDLPFEAIIQGTAAYLKEKKKEGWAYTISSDYFILKNSASELESWADAALEGDLPKEGADNFVTSLN